MKYLFVLMLFLASNVYADGALGKTSKGTATITLVIPAYVFNQSEKSFGFNYDEPYQMTSIVNGQYKVVKRCSSQASCSTFDSKARIIIFEPL